MSMIKCPECGEAVSDQAKACPKCGCPIRKKKGIWKFVLIGVVFLFVLVLILPEEDVPAQDSASGAVAASQDGAAGSGTAKDDASGSQTAKEDAAGIQTARDDASGSGTPKEDASGSETAKEDASGSETPKDDAAGGSSAVACVSNPSADAKEQTTQAQESTAAAGTDASGWSGDASLDFAVQLNTGEDFTLSEQTGKVVLLNFWATWCGPCVEEMPALQSLYDEYGDGGDVRIVLINAGESAQTVHRFLSQNSYTVPCVYDTDSTVNMQYGVDAIPYTVILNKDGTTAATFEGSYGCETQYELYKEAIEEALAQ